MDDEEDLFGSDAEDDKEKVVNPEDKKHVLRRDLRSMVYGFGDDKVGNRAVQLFESKFICISITN